MSEHPTVTIRPYEDADLEGVISVFLRSVREVAVRDYNQAQIDAWAQADRNKWRARRLSRPTWVALNAGEIVGFSVLEPDGHLDMIFVHPVYQGRGVATSLLAVVEGAARAQGLVGLFTEASVTARRFFEKRGFEVVTRQEVLIRGEILCNFQMRKTLS